MTEVAGGEGLGPRHTSGVAEVIVDESRGSHKPAVITTTATGASIDLSEVISNSLQSQHVSQTLLESRKDFHTHPRSLALAHLQLADWRTHEKLRTAGALLAVCLNLGTDPPDLVRPKDRARLEAWVDPDAPMQVPTPEELALEAANNAGAQRNVARERTPMKAIGESLQRQFEHINRHAKYRQLLDCSMEDLRKQCMGFRRAAKEERLLFYYNGHGVPRPTTGGDIWVFNKQFTQYIPVSAMDLMSWIGTPCVYVWDCAHAMNIVHAFEKNAKIRDFEISRIRHAAEAAGIKLPVGKSGPETMAMVSANISALLASQTQTGAMPNPQTSQQQTSQTQQQHQYGPVNPALINLAVLPPTHHEDIHFAASQLGELLPTNPELPADLFTSCLTTPIKAALRFWVIRNPRTSKVTLDLCDKLPGSVQDRRTPFGELNWIFTSISDTIAWSTLPRDLFHKLFRQDVVVASLFRNFMLADRMMRFYNVHPQSRPAIPSTHKHPLWDSLDLEIDMCLQQLPRLLKEESRRKQREDRANRVKQERVARASARRGPHRQSPLHGIGPMDFGGQQRIVLEIADTFRPARGRRGRAVLGGIQESDDDDVISGNDSDGVDMGSELGLNVAVTGYISSTYFSNQLYAFEVWLQHAATEVSQFVSDNGPDQIPRSLSTEPPPNLDPPDELPAVLQVLLSQQYRLRALILLYRFMNLGPWAVNLAMAVGIFPYMSKLLASTTAEIREILILVWARLIAVDMALHAELMKNDGMEYFVAYLANNIQMQYEPVSEKVRLCDTVSAASAFTLTMLCKDMPEVQQACFNERVLDYFLVYLQRPDNGTEERSCLRTWILMCLGELWRTFPNAKWMAMTYRLCVIASKKQQHEERGRHSGAGEQAGTPSFEELLASSADDDSVDACDAQDLLVQMAFHRTPVVRAAAVYAMGTLIEDLSLLGDDPGVLTIVHKAERQVYALLLQAATDGSPIVRREVVCIIGSAVFASYMPQAIEAVARVVSEELREQRRPPQPPQQQGDAASEAVQDLMVKLYKVLLKLSVDGHPDVALVARETCDVLMQCYAHSRMFFASESSLDQAIHRLEISRSANGQQPILGFIRSAGTGIGDALLGYPPLSHSELPASPTSGMNRQLQQQQQARRMPQTRSRNSMVGQRGRDMSGQQNGSVPAHHRYTMHFAQGSVPRQSLFGQQTPPTPRSPSAAGSISAASLANLDLQSPHSQHQNTEAARARDRFAGMDDAERADAMLKFGEVEQAWLEWGRHELRETVCASTLLDWAGAHFTEFDISLFANVSGPLQSSASLVESRERNRRMVRMEQDARIMSSQAVAMKWIDVRAVASMKEPATMAIMHPLESHAVVASSRGTVSVFDWEAQAQVGHYSIGSCGNFSEAMSISSLHLINPLGQAKLLAGTRDGKVRIFASHAPDFVPPAGNQAPVFPRPRLLTAFTALPWASPSISVGYGHNQAMPSASTVGQNQRLKAHQQNLAPTLSVNDTGLDSALSGSTLNEPEGCGLVTAWNQRSGILFAGGNDKEVRVWDITQEMCVEEIAVASMGGITCISHDGVSGNIFAVGNTNGLVRVMDRRMDARTGTVANWREHTPSKICNVFIRPGQAEVVSASENGDVKYWDLRHRESVFTLADTHPDHTLQYMVAHESAPVVMTASDATVKFWNQRGSSIGAVPANRSGASGAASYMKTLAGYGASRTQMVRVSAAALHGYLPVAVMVSDDGRVSCIQPVKASMRPPPTLASSRASSIL